MNECAACFVTDSNALTSLLTLAVPALESLQHHKLTDEILLICFPLTWVDNINKVIHFASVFIKENTLVLMRKAMLSLSFNLTVY